MTAAALAACSRLPRSAAEPDSCATVRFSDVGWTDITATTAVATTILEALGYETKIDMLSVPVTYDEPVARRFRRLPRQLDADDGGDIAPYRDDGTVETVRTNLEGAKYTLAVSKSLADEGLTDFADIAEVQGPARRARSTASSRATTATSIILDMIEATPSASASSSSRKARSRGCWRRRRGRRRGEGIVFLGWEPHPMNKNVEMVYLTGGDDVLRAELRRRDRLTNVRKGFVEECPNVGRSCRTSFTLDMENDDHGHDPR